MKDIKWTWQKHNTVKATGQYRNYFIEIRREGWKPEIFHAEILKKGSNIPEITITENTIEAAKSKVKKFLQHNTRP